MSDIGKWDARAFYDKLGPRKPVRNVHLKSFKVSKHGDQLRILVRTTGEDADIRVIMDRKFRFVFADEVRRVVGRRRPRRKPLRTPSKFDLYDGRPPHYVQGLDEDGNDVWFDPNEES